MPAKTIILGSVAALLLSGAASAAPTAAIAAPGLGKTLVKTSRADAPDQRYCIVSEVTGSRIARKTCDSLSAWQDQGVDPRQLPRRR